MGLTQGLLASMIIDAVPARLRGTAFGVFHMVSGFALLAASALAGLLWDRYSPPATFYAGMVLAALTLIGLLAVRAPRPGDIRPDGPPQAG